MPEAHLKLFLAYASEPILVPPDALSNHKRILSANNFYKGSNPFVVLLVVHDLKKIRQIVYSNALGYLHPNLFPEPQAS